MKVLGILVVCLFAVVANSRVLVVSDIDDTLKISQVRSTLGSVLNAGRTDVVFAGMPQLLRSLQEGPRADIEFVYLSNAPHWLMAESHSAFLNEHQFPKGRVFLRGFLDDSRHFKSRVLDQLAKEDPKQVIVLVGDNGERDPVFFAEFIHRHPGLRIKSFVHSIYATNVEQFQFNSSIRPYATAYDLGLKWFTAGLNDQSLPQQVFPEWMDCHPALHFRSRYLNASWRKILNAGCRRGSGYSRN